MTGIFFKDGVQNFLELYLKIKIKKQKGKTAPTKRNCKTPKQNDQNNVYKSILSAEIPPNWLISAL